MVSDRSRGEGGGLSETGAAYTASRSRLGAIVGVELRFAVIRKVVEGSCRGDVGAWEMLWWWWPLLSTVNWTRSLESRNPIELEVIATWRA